MKYKNGFLGRLFAGEKSVSTGRETVSYSFTKEKGKLNYLDILDLRLDNGRLSIITATKTLNITFLSYTDSQSLHEDLTGKIKAKISAYLSTHEHNLADLTADFNKLLETQKYISQNDIRQWLSTMPDVGKYLSHRLFTPSLIKFAVPGLSSILKFFEPNSGVLSNRNEIYIKSTIEKYKYLFDTIEKYPLTNEQKRAIVTDEDRNLLIAAAGSGKTSTLIGKAIFLIEKGLAKPDEILLLSFNKDAQLEIQKRLDLLIDSETYQVSPMARTFHSYGYEVVSNAEGKKPALSDAASSPSGMITLITQLINDLCSQSTDFSTSWFRFTSLYLRPYTEAHRFRTYGEYNDYLRQLADDVREARVEYGELAPTFLFETIDGKLVKSIEEARICTWLFINGIHYEYEEPYQVNTADHVFRQYYPDFYYPEVGLYHEHFALDKSGNPPSFFRDYLDGVAWKRALHEENGTHLIETTSAEVYDDTIFEKLESRLKSYGVKFNRLSIPEIEAALDATETIAEYTQLFTTFLKHFKANDADIDKLKKKAQSFRDPGRCTAFLNIFEEVYQAYQKQLTQKKQIDFEDQINKACGYLENKIVQHGFKYILVDEFQDISQDRKRMLLAMLDQSPYIKLFAVGDDWQSIYRFGGADIDIMTNFQEHFGATSLNYLTQTFRSYQGIVNVAAEFVQKNPRQIKKVITAQTDIDGKNLVRIEDYSDDIEESDLIHNLLSGFSEIAQKNYTRLSIFLLGRYRRNEPPLLNKYKHQFKQLDIEFKTIHQSKGLEADYIILLAANDGFTGFPCGILDDPLLNLVIPKPEEFPHSEERRLMYVALTRAKRCAYIHTRRNFTSIFVSELASYRRVSSPKSLESDIVCPACNEGRMVRRKSKHGIFYGCSKFPHCRNTMKSLDTT